MILISPVRYSMCDLIKVSSIFTIAPCWVRMRGSIYAAPIPCGARRDLALESGFGCFVSFVTSTRTQLLPTGMKILLCLSTLHILYPTPSTMMTSIFSVVVVLLAMHSAQAFVVRYVTKNIFSRGAHSTLMLAEIHSTALTII
jgi:hypothetical protein